MPAANPEPHKILFICSQNKWRSLTAERLFDGDTHYEAHDSEVFFGSNFATRLSLFYRLGRNPDIVRLAVNEKI